MYTENQFIREFSNTNNPNQIWQMRVFYRALSKKQKKKYTSELVKFKQKLSFEEWWRLVTFNVQEGMRRHRKNQQRGFLVDHELEAMKEKVRTKEFLEYHKLKR